jgi:hypothetical protein
MDDALVAKIVDEVLHSSDVATAVEALVRASLARDRWEERALADDILSAAIQVIDEHVCA